MWMRLVTRRKNSTESENWPDSLPTPIARACDSKKMKTTLLFDLGSTYTKCAVIALDEARVVGQASSLTTVGSDVSLGVAAAVARAIGGRFNPKDFDLIRATSSAAGGLRIVALGLTETMTAHAAQQAALGAGGKVVATYTGKLDEAGMRAIECHAPDVILLSGGFDGGDCATIVHNAQFLALSRLRCPIVVAGNRDAKDEIVAILNPRFSILAVANVLPEPGRLNLVPAREAIRRVFAEHIVEAKGLHAIREIVDGDVVPTPSAVLTAAQLLADGTPHQRGMGELIVVDVGGATTDVHSIAVGESNRRNVVLELDDEPRVKRTVEGDLGMRVSALTLLEAAGEKMVMTKASVGAVHNRDRLREQMMQLSKEVGLVPTDDATRALDLGLGRSAVALAVERHVGRLVREAGSSVIIQRGKDLTEVGHVIGTGGVFAHSPDAAQMLDEVVATSRDTVSLKPRAPKLWVDKSYLLWACGLLAEVDAETAMRVARQTMTEVESTEVQ